MSPLAVENGSLVTSGGSLCETCCSPPPETGACCVPLARTDYQDVFYAQGCSAAEAGSLPTVIQYKQFAESKGWKFTVEDNASGSIGYCECYGEKSGDWDDGGLFNPLQDELRANCGGASTVYDADLNTCGNGTGHECREDQTLDECNIAGGTWHPDKSCAEIDCPPAEWGVCCLPPDHPTLPNSCEAVANKAECDAFGGTFYAGKGCNDPSVPCGSGACCYIDNGGAYRCTDGDTQEQCDARGGMFYQGQSCGEIDCSNYYVDCFQDGTVPGADCTTCGNSPFYSYEDANNWILANPPPPGCEQTIVEVPARRNPLP